jgi:L-ascorbate metabolism protein UlaG (beta-lactamase superfamily)
MTLMLRVAALVLGLAGLSVSMAAAQDTPRGSECLAMAEAPPRATPVSLRRLSAKADDVTITYAGHSTYYIDTPGGVRIATDFSGVYTSGRLPDVVTMNRAHSTHYTLFPDPRIPHVLHGWNDDGSPARINERIGDVLIRNVTTDIRRYFMDDSSGEMIKDGNSIFIFEVAGLCIGHLGHLHHKLDDSHFAAIGRLDILMVPIDGAYTMSLDGVSEITRRVRPAIRDRRADRTQPDDIAGFLACGANCHHSARRLVPTFRSSCPIATPTFTNFEKSWALANLLF